MTSLAAARAANAAAKLRSPVSVIVGGTNGIGAALAIKLAEHSSNPTIHIVGRNKTAADKVLNDMRAVNAEGAYEFHKCDVSLLSQIRPLTHTLRTRLPKITHLILTPGIMTTQGRTHASPDEPNDIKMMLHYYSRVLFTRELLPSLQAASESPDASREGGGLGRSKVMTVYDAKAGDIKKLDWDDLDLQRGYSLTKAATHCITMTDVTWQRFAQHNPSISFTHAYPGLVHTSLGTSSLPSLLRGPASFLTRTFGVTPDQCAEWLFAGMQNDRDTNGAGVGEARARFIDNHGDVIRGKVRASEEEMERVWKDTVGLVDRGA